MTKVKTDSICWAVGACNPDTEILAPGEKDYVIAVDGGWKFLEKKGIRADLALGDFDSLGFVPGHPHTMRHPVMKDDTDMMLAVKEGLRLGYRSFYLLGGLGGRMGHTLANIQTLAFLASQGAVGILAGEETRMTAIRNSSICFDERFNGYVSIFAFGGKAEGVTLEGLRYSLSDAELSPFMPLGVSNEFIHSSAKISVRSGTLLITWSGANPELLQRI